MHKLRGEGLIQCRKYIKTLDKYICKLYYKNHKTSHLKTL